jgi:hypothetical protein
MLAGKLRDAPLVIHSAMRGHHKKAYRPQKKFRLDLRTRPLVHSI